MPFPTVLKHVSTPRQLPRLVVPQTIINASVLRQLSFRMLPKDALSMAVESRPALLC